MLLCVSIFCTTMLLMTIESFYGCSEASNETWFMFAIDVYRLVTTVILSCIVFLKINTTLRFGNTSSKFVFATLCLGSLVAFLIHIIKISEADSSGFCLMKKLGDDWSTELEKIFTTTECLLDTNAKDVIETMENPYVMTSAASWCPERIKKRCFNQDAKSDDITNCLRHGRTDLVNHTKFVYIFDLVGDVCRVFVCFFLAYSKSSKGSEPAEAVVDVKKSNLKFRL